MPFSRRTPPQETPPPTPRVAGVIPCAGASTRMGRSKALLDAGGRSFLSATVGALVGGGCDPVVVVVGPGQADEARRAKAAGAAVLENPDPGEGPITSLRLALAVLAGSVEGVAFLPVDHPQVRPETVAALVDAFLGGEAPLVLPTLFPALAEAGLEGGARSVVHAHLDTATLLAVDDPGVVTDIDTPDAYRKAFGQEATP